MQVMVVSLVFSIACRSLVVSLFFGQCARARNFRPVRCSLSWWRGLLPSSLSPERWDARTATLRIHSALFEVIAQLKLQNQELMSLLATQQSSREPGMSSGCLQTETKPLDMVDPATVNAAWNVVKKRKEQARDPSARVTALEQLVDNQEKNKKESERDPSVRELVQDGWSVPVIQPPKISVWSTLVSVWCREAQDAILELRSNHGLAFLTTKNIFGLVEVEFEVKTAQGQSAMWKRYLVQLGCTPATFKCSAPKRWARGGRHSTCGGRISQTALSLRCVEDGNEQAEVRSCTLAQEIGGGTSGFYTAKIWRARRGRIDCESPEGLPREGASRKRRVRCLHPSLPRQRRVKRVQRRPASRRVRPPGSSAEGESDWVSNPGCRPVQEGSWIANQRVRLREGCWTDLHSRGSQEVHLGTGGR